MFNVGSVGWVEERNPPYMEWWVSASLLPTLHLLGIQTFRFSRSQTLFGNACLDALHRTIMIFRHDV